MVTCPCCGYRTLSEPNYGSYEICEVCGWEDDHVQLRHPTMGGGANTASLFEAQQAFAALSDVQPKAYERDAGWRPLDPAREIQSEDAPSSGLEYFHASGEDAPNPYWLKD